MIKGRDIVWRDRTVRVHTPVLSCPGKKDNGGTDLSRVVPHVPLECPAHYEEEKSHVEATC
jgi:hypothetical protein